MLTYDDIRAMKRGKEAEIQERSAQVAASKLQEIAQSENQQTEAMDNAALKADARKIIQELQNNPDLDPQEVIDSLPPVLQQAVFELMGQTHSLTQEDPMAEEHMNEDPIAEEPMAEEPIGGIGQGASMMQGGTGQGIGGQGAGQGMGRGMHRNVMGQGIGNARKL